MIGISNLAFMNDTPNIRFPCLHRIENLIKWNRDSRYRSGEQAQRQIRTRLQPRYCNSCRAKPLSNLFEAGWGLAKGHQHRAVAVSHARTARQQRIFVRQVSVGMYRDSRDM